MDSDGCIKILKYIKISVFLIGWQTGKLNKYLNVPLEHSLKSHNECSAPDRNSCTQGENFLMRRCRPSPGGTNVSSE